MQPDNPGLRRLFISIGYLVSAGGLVYLGLLLLVGFSPGWGMSGGTVQQFWSGLAYGLTVFSLGFLIVSVSKFWFLGKPPLVRSRIRVLSIVVLVFGAPFFGSQFFGAIKAQWEYLTGISDPLTYYGAFFRMWFFSLASLPIFAFVVGIAGLTVDRPKIGPFFSKLAVVVGILWMTRLLISVAAR